MAKHRPRFFTKTLIGMSAAIGLAVMMPRPARAETTDLICNAANVANIADNVADLHVYLDTDRQSVITYFGDTKREGRFAASISDTFIRWTQRDTNYEARFTIDRVAGTMSFVSIEVGNRNEFRGQCRRATQKF